jgi:hypothetical protein
MTKKARVIIDHGEHKIDDVISGAEAEAASPPAMPTAIPRRRLCREARAPEGARQGRRRGLTLDISRQQAARSCDRQDQLHHAGGRLHRAAQDPRAVEQSALDRRSVGDFTIPATPNGRLYRCTTGGTTGAGEPSWSTTDGGTTADGGTVVWTEHTPSLRSATNIPECAYTGYARVSAPALFGAAASLSSSNTSAMQFPRRPAAATRWSRLRDLRRIERGQPARVRDEHWLAGDQDDPGQ